MKRWGKDRIESILNGEAAYFTCMVPCIWAQ